MAHYHPTIIAGYRNFSPPLTTYPAGEITPMLKLLLFCLLLVTCWPLAIAAVISIH